MSHQPSEPHGAQRAKAVRAWSVVASMFVLPVLVFSAEYLFVPERSVLAFYREGAWFFDLTRIGLAYKITHNVGFLYYCIYLASMVIMYPINMVASTSLLLRSKNFHYLLERNLPVGTKLKRLALILIFPASLLFVPGAYRGTPFSAFRPNAFGIFSYSFFYFGFCFFTIIFWSVLVFKIKKRLSNDWRK